MAKANQSLADLYGRVCQLQKIYAEGGPQYQDKSLIEKAKFSFAADALAQLKDILETTSDDLTMLSTALDDFFSIQWSLIKGTALCYTATPQWDMTQLMCDMAELNDALKKERGDERDVFDCPLSNLMPGIIIETSKDPYKDLNELPIQLVLQTHILSDSGLYLLPVEVLSEWEVRIPADRQKIGNPYFKLDLESKDEAPGWLSVSECQRLFDHSGETKSLQEGYEDYFKALTEGSHLQGRLQTLCGALYFNSAHGGIGEADDAAGGAYGALKNFFDYYQTLSLLEKQKIPYAVSREIDYLFALLTNPTANHNVSGENVETCISNRRVKLLSAMEGYTGVLSEIGLTADSKENFLNAAEEKLKKSQDLFVRLLKSADYCGSDPLPLTSDLMRELEVHVSISSPEDVSSFVRLKKEDMVRLLADYPWIRKRIFDNFSDINQLVIFCLDTPPDRLELIFDQSYSSAWLTSLTKTDRAVNAWLISLSPEKCRILFHASVRPRVGFTVASLKRCVEFLSPEQKQAVINDAVVVDFLKDTKNTEELCFLLRYVNLKNPSEAMVAEIRRLARKNVVYMANNLRQLSAEQRLDIFRCIKDLFFEEAECDSAEFAGTVFCMLGGGGSYQYTRELLELFGDPRERLRLFHCIRAELPFDFPRDGNLNDFLELFAPVHRRQITVYVRFRHFRRYCWNVLKSVWNTLGGGLDRHTLFDECQTTGLIDYLTLGIPKLLTKGILFLGRFFDVPDETRLLPARFYAVYDRFQDWVVSKLTVWAGLGEGLRPLMHLVVRFSLSWIVSLLPYVFQWGFGWTGVMADAVCSILSTFINIELANYTGAFLNSIYYLSKIAALAVNVAHRIVFAAALTVVLFSAVVAFDLTVLALSAVVSAVRSACERLVVLSEPEQISGEARHRHTWSQVCRGLFCRPGKTAVSPDAVLNQEDLPQNGYVPQAPQYTPPAPGIFRV